MFEIKDVSMIYDMNSDEKMYALNGFNLTLPDSGLVGIIGPSGSGKSTLCMLCLPLKCQQKAVLPTMDRSLQSLQISRGKI